MLIPSPAGFHWILEKNNSELVINQVCIVVCEFYDVTLNELISHSQSPRITDPRDVCFYILVEIYGLGNSYVARHFKRRPCNVTNGRSKIKNIMPQDQRLANFVTECFIKV